MITIDPKTSPVAKIHASFQGVVAPRPIALASTVDREGRINLSPFSFFNIFSTSPAILVFSPSRRLRDDTTKHTYENVLEVPEVVINIVNFSMVEQASLTSVEFGKGVNEFIKSGLTPVPSERVQPPRVAESPAAFECLVKQVIPLGDKGGAGNLVVCEVVLAHFKEELFDDHGRVDPQQLDAVARMGGDYYCRAHGDNIFVIPKPTNKPAIGFDQIPLAVRNSSVLSGNDLGRLANIQAFPTEEEVRLISEDQELREALTGGEIEVHRLAKKKLQEGKVEEAWKVLLILDLKV